MFSNAFLLAVFYFYFCCLQINELRQAIKNIGNIAVMLVLLVSTTGLTIYKLHCNCLHHEHLSVFVEPESCHSNVGTHYCAGTNHGDYTDHCDSSCDRCDTREVFFVKLNAQFLTGNPTVTVAPVPVEILKTLFTEKSKIQCPWLYETKVTLVDSPPPLIIPGQKIVTLFHQFKFDIHVPLV